MRLTILLSFVKIDKNDTELNAQQKQKKLEPVTEKRKDQSKGT